MLDTPRPASLTLLSILLAALLLGGCATTDAPDGGCPSETNDVAIAAPTTRWCGAVWPRTRRR